MSMYNYSSEQKPYYPTKQNSIEVEETNYDEIQLQSAEKIAFDFSDKISKIMFPFYEGFKSQSENGKVLGLYPILKFPSVQEVKNNVRMVSENSSQQDPYSQRSVNFQQLANRVQQRQKMEYQVVSQKKIHQLLDQNEARSSYDDEMSPDQEYGSGKMEYNKFKKARRYYEKLAREIKSNKKLKRRFKDKNRPKKAKSAYNLFVEQVVPQIKAQNPSFSAPDLVRVAAKMYNQLTQEEKVPYQRRYLVDKERFEREREAYFRQHPEMDYRMDAKQKASFMNDKYMQF